MTNEHRALVRQSYDQLSSRLDAIGRTFYERLFAADPGLRELFPSDLRRQQLHFEAGLALILRNIEAFDVIEPALMALGADHAAFGARPGDYVLARRALLDALRTHADPSWTPETARAWGSAITAILVSMLRGAAASTAIAAEQLARLDADLD
jgi:hemoglobin-like flavoprotein